MVNVRANLFCRESRDEDACSLEINSYRYIHNYTWEQIGDELGADSRTVRRWHGKALTHVELPENPIKI